MEPFGAAASAIAVLGLSVQVAKAITSATGATQERKKLREEVRSLEATLQQLADEADDSEEGEEWRATMEALEAPGAPLGRLEHVLREVLAKLQPESGRAKAMSAIKWPFKERQILETLAAIEREKSLLQLALENNNRRLLQEIKSTAKSNGEKLAAAINLLGSHVADTTARLGELRKNHVDMKDLKLRENILKWLSTADYTLQQGDFIRRRQDGTGIWLLESSEYKTWSEGRKATLFCPGIPGAGKTILTSVVVENLLDKAQQNPGIAVAYIYCDFNRQKEQQAEDLLGSLAQQITEQRQVPPDALKNLYQTYGERGSPSIKELSSAIASVVPLYSQVFVVMDAIDECQPSSRTKMLSVLFDLQKEHNINLFATCRPIPHIADSFSNAPTIKIRADATDVRLSLDGQMSDLPSFVQRSPDLQEEIRTSIIDVTDGMFLLAQLHIRSLVGKRSPKAVKSALSNLPQGSGAYDFAYNDAMLRIEGQPRDQAELAKEALAWIVRSKRQLNASELQHALAVEAEELFLDPDNVPGVEDILSACAGLVTLVEKSGVVRLVHYTTQEYFQRSWARWFEDAETHLTTVCVAYLSFSRFRDSTYTVERDVRQQRLADDEKILNQRRNEENPLYEYAAINWGHHARDMEQPWPRFLEFLSSPTAVESAAENFFRAQKSLSSSFRYCPRDLTSLHLLSMHDLLLLARQLPICSGQVNAQDSWGQTPLIYAVCLGYEQMARWLLEKGADPEIRDSRDRSAIFYAAKYDRHVILEIMLQDGHVNPDILDKDGLRPLVVAAQKGHLEVVNLLLKTGKVRVEAPDDLDLVNLDMNLVSFDFRRNAETSALEAAAKEANTTVVKALLSHGWTECRHGEKRSTALHHAAASGSVSTLRILLDADEIDVNARDEAGKTPLVRGIIGKACSSDLVDALLAVSGIEPDLSDDDGVSPLSWAVKQFSTNAEQYLAVMRSLIGTAKVDVNSLDRWGQTPLFYAASSAQYEAAKLLLSINGIDVGRKNIRGVSPLLVLAAARPSHGVSPPLVLAAARPSHLKPELTVELLLEISCVDVNAKDDEGWTPLARATSGGTGRVASLLLAAPGIDFDAPTAGSIGRGRRPLSFASFGNVAVYAATVQELLAKGADVNAIDDMGFTALSWAASQASTYGSPMQEDHLSKIRMLLDSGADVDHRDSQGRTPLSYAIRHGNAGIVHILLSRGADVRHRDDLEKTPLHYLGRSTDLSTVKLMVESKADVNARDHRGMTPLMKAAWVEHANGSEMIKILLEAGARIDERDDSGHTALWYACGEHGFGSDMQKSVQVLLDHGADIRSKDNEGLTVASWASNRYGIAELIREHELKDRSDIAGLMGELPIRTK